MYWTLENVPWTNLHDLNLDWIINTMKQTVEQWIAYRLEMDENFTNFTEQINNDFDDFTTQINSNFSDFTTQINTWKTLIESEFTDLQTYVQNYFDNLNLNESTRYVINQMIASGEFVQVLNPSIVSATEAWLAEHITPTTPVVDDTLTISGAAADAKATGDALKNINTNLNNKINDKINDIAVPGANLFDPSAGVEGYALLTTNGELFEAPLYTASDFMPVEAGKLYKYQQFQSGDSGLVLILYDGNKTFVRREISIVGFTVPAGVEFARMSVKTTYINDVMFSKATSSPNGVYYPFEMWVNGEKIVPQTVGSNVLSKDSVTTEKTTFLTPINNLFLSETITEDRAIDSNTGFPFTIDGYYVSDFIPVNPNSVYSLSDTPYLVAQYDKTQVYIGTVSPATTYLNFTVGSNVEFIRVSFPDSVPADRVILTQGSWVTASAEKHGEVLSDDIKIQPDSVRDVIFKASSNLFDMSNIIYKRYLLGNGTLMAIDGYYTTDFIACEQETTYNIYPEGTERIVFYNANKEFISAQTGIYNDFTTPTNTAFFRFTNSLTRTQLARLQITKGSGVQRHEAFNEYGIIPKRQKIATLADAWWKWSKGEKYPIGFLGDSTTDGAGTTHGATHEAEDNAAGGYGKVDYINPDAYPYIVEQMCRNELGNNTLRVYNIGYTGTYYDWAIPKYDEIFGNVYSDVKMVGLVYGINDRVRYTTAYDYFAIFRNNLIYTIDYLYNRGIQPFLVTTQATAEPATRTDMPTLNLRTSRYIKSIADEIMHSIAKEYNLEIVEMNDFDEYVLSFGEQPVSVIVPDTLHFSDYGNKIEGEYIFSKLNLRTVDITRNCTLSFVTQLCKSEVPANVLTTTRANDFNCYVNWTRSDVTTPIILQDFWVNNLTGSKVKITACCPEALGQTVEIDGVNTTITTTEQIIATLDVGVHHITAITGATEKVSWYGFKIETI